VSYWLVGYEFYGMHVMERNVLFFVIDREGWAIACGTCNTNPGCNNSSVDARTRATEDPYRVWGALEIEEVSD
jgi:hypothetical protein